MRRSPGNPRLGPQGLFSRFRTDPGSEWRRGDQGLAAGYPRGLAGAHEVGSILCTDGDGRGSSVFPLTQASAGRINKQVTAYANALERHIGPLRIHFSIPMLAQYPGTSHPSQPNEAFKNPIHLRLAT